MREVGKFRIALIGLVTPELAFCLMPETLGDIKEDDFASHLSHKFPQAHRNYLWDGLYELLR